MPENEKALETPAFREGVAPATDTFPEGSASGQLVDAVYDVPVQISAVLGRVTMPVSDLLKLGRGAVVQLDKRLGESIDILVNNRLVARGEVVVMDEHLGITITELLKADHF